MEPGVKYPNFTSHKSLQQPGLRRSVRATPTASIAPNDKKWGQGKYSPGYNLIVTVGGVAIAEAIAMLVVYFYRFLPYYQQVLLDTVVMAAIISPLLYFLSTRPLLRHIRQRAQTESIIQARLRLIQSSNTQTVDELLQATLDEIEALTGSTVGYFHFLEPDQKTLWLQAWSTHTLQSVRALRGDDHHLDMDQAGIWAECIRGQKPVIHNDHAFLPNRKGTPEGHAHMSREMAIPIMRDRKIAAILGMGNKPQDYTATDVELVSTLADFVWDIIQHRQAGDALRRSEEKFRTLVDWTYDWEIWLDPQGDIIYNSPSCERITGYKPEEFIAASDLIISIIHPEDRLLYQDHQKLVHDESAGVEEVEFRVIARDGQQRWIEHVCRPLFAEENRYLGRRVSNRDITERKQAEMDIQERNQKEKLLTQTIHTMQLDIARDLHDTVGQNIGYLRMKLDHLSDTGLQRQIDINNELRILSEVANESYDLIRGTLAVLQSESSADLFRLFIRYAEQIQERSSFKIDFSSQGDPRLMSARRMRQLFYIFREALNNIEKHSNASQVSIEMTWDEDCLTFVIFDNGKGFDVNATQFGSHYGLKFMRERAELLNGSLIVHSGMGAGTEILIQMPYDDV